MADTGISKDQLKEILAEVIKAVKEPTVLEQRKIVKQEEEIRQAQEDRKKLAESLIQDKENKRTNQRICSHEHKNGDSHCVYIIEKNSPGYILCQRNQCKIRPGVAPENYKGDDIYSTELFNKLFQKLPSNEMFQ
jgi:hypothetical protein